MVEQKKIEDFIENWDIDIANKSARHKSGIGFNFEYENTDGSLHVEVEDLVPWEQEMFKNNRDSKDVDAELSSLRQEFSKIYKERITGKSQLSQKDVFYSAMQQHSRSN